MTAWYKDYEVDYGGMTNGVRLLLGFTILANGLQSMYQNGGYDVAGFFGLSLYGLLQGFVWEPVTYMFLHGPWYHLALNMLILFTMGPETEKAIGRNQFFIMYFVSGILGGIGWLIISAAETPTAPCIGASGAVFGIIGAFAALFPRRPITLLLLFVIPVTMKAWVLAVVLGSLELVLLLTHAFGGHIANAAHIAGGLAGFIYAYVVFGRVPELDNEGGAPSV